MEFIDILVRELPKRGGWPEGAVECVRFVDEATIDFYDENGNWPDDCYLTYGPIAKAICITPTEQCQRETVKFSEYEAALASSKTEWDGDGFPPVGTVVEAFNSVTGMWYPVLMVYSSGRNTAWLELNRGGNIDSCSSSLMQFRPIHSEADKKKEEAIFAIADLCRESASNGHSAELIYDAIKSGKIVIE